MMDIIEEGWIRQFKAQRWIVHTNRVEDSIHVYPAEGNCCLTGFGDYVRSPNFIERLLGYTFESKIEKSKEKYQKWCDKQNAKIDAARAVIGEEKN